MLSVRTELGKEQYGGVIENRDRDRGRESSESH